VSASLDLDWAPVWDWFRTDGLLIAIVLLGAVLVSMLSGVVVRRTRARLEDAESATETVGLQRRATLGRVVTNALRALIWTTAIVLILVSLGVDLAPLVTGAGLVALAVAFGTQHLIHDVVNGIFVLVENQYDVGDLVTLRIEGGAEVTGWVRVVTFRATELEIDGGMTEVVSNARSSRRSTARAAGGDCSWRSACRPRRTPSASVASWTAPSRRSGRTGASPARSTRGPSSTGGRPTASSC
jgi:small-conductance mechanosensitive channel